jgi:hypothetical protein
MRDKTHPTDVDARLEAFHNEQIRPVPTKTVTQQVVATLHRLRSGWLADGVRSINAGLMRQLGFFIPEGRRHVLPEAWEIIQDAPSPRPPLRSGALHPPPWLEPHSEATQRCSSASPRGRTGIMGTNTRQRSPLEWTPLSLHHPRLFVVSAPHPSPPHTDGAPRRDTPPPVLNGTARGTDVFLRRGGAGSPHTRTPPRFTLGGSDGRASTGVWCSEVFGALTGS